MGGFIRRLFGGGSKQAPQSAPPAPVQSVGAPPQAPVAKSKARPKGKTKYTGELGLSQADRSNTNMKTLTGQ